MTEPMPKRQRTTPRSSNANDFIAPADTPYSTLRQLSSALRVNATPGWQRASSAGPTPANRYGNRTPVTVSRTPRDGRARQTPRRGAPTTPHAIRALQQRRIAALTPGQNRRRSGRMQRETPRDILRNLSRVLARNTQPVEPSPPPPSTKPKRNAAYDDFEDEPELQPPRLSMALDEDDDDSFGIAPPRLSLAPEEMEQDLTMHSMEAGRRAVSEDPQLSRRYSERFAELNELGELDNGFEIDGTFIRMRGEEEEEEMPEEEDDEDELGGDETGTLREFLRRRQSRQSDLGIMGDGDETDTEPTFRFTIPQRLERRSLVQQAAEEDAQPDVDGDDEVDVTEDHDEQPPLPGPDDDTDEDEEQPFEAEVDEAEVDLEDEEDIEVEDPTQAELRQDSVTRHLSPGASIPTKSKKTSRRKLRKSRFGIEYPPLPAATVRRLATTFARQQGAASARINKETLEAIMDASELFFEQIAEDLASYADHAGRKRIEEADVSALMSRQRMINQNATPFSLAQKYLPRELLQEIRMPPPSKLKKSAKRRRMATIAEEEEEEE